MTLMTVAQPLARAQANPEPAACGLPTQGNIVSSVTYTLSADCTQTGQIQISTPGGDDPDIVLTIDGNGYAVSASETSAQIIRASSARSPVKLNDITIDGGGGSRSGSMIQANTLEAERVTLKGSSGAPALGTINGILTDVLFENNTTTSLGTGANGSALSFNTGTVTLTNAVVRNNAYGGAALLSHSGTIITNGCLSFSGNVPKNIGGQWTDNSTGACGGAIGNGDSINPPPALRSCGLPGPGALDVSAQYIMTSDCDFGVSGSNPDLWNIGEGVTITIQGNGHRLSGGVGDSYSWVNISENSRLAFKNVDIEKLFFVNFGEVEASHSTITNTSTRIFFHLGAAQFSNVLFENVTTPTSVTASNATIMVALSITGAGDATFSDTVFRNNTGLGGAPMLNATGDSVITLSGCISFENNLPSNTAGNVTDNSTGACSSDVLIGPDSSSFISVGGKRDRERKSVQAEATVSEAAESKEEVSSGEKLAEQGYELSAQYGLESGVEFQRVDAAGVGNQSIIDLGLIDAIDVWAYVDQGVEVCFPQSGYLHFLDATTSPRTVTTIETFVKDGNICALIDRPGTVVLTANPAPGSPLPAPAEPGTALTGCMVKTNNILNFRDGPGGALLGNLIPNDVTLTALRRTSDWILVDYMGARGWISADYVTAQGSCA